MFTSDDNWGLQQAMEHVICNLSQLGRYNLAKLGLFDSTHCRHSLRRDLTEVLVAQQQMPPGNKFIFSLVQVTKCPKYCCESYLWTSPNTLHEKLLPVYGPAQVRVQYILERLILERSMPAFEEPRGDRQTTWLISEHMIKSVSVFQQLTEWKNTGSLLQLSPCEPLNNHVAEAHRHMNSC